MLRLFGSGYAGLGVRFIQFLFFLGGFPQRDQVVLLALFVLADFEDRRIQPFAYPPDGPVLFGQIEAPVQIIGVREYLLDFLETDASLRIRSEPCALPAIEVEPHRYNCYTISKTRK